MVPIDLVCILFACFLRRVMVLHCLQLLPHTPYRDADLNRRFNMNPGQKEVRATHPAVREVSRAVKAFF